MSGSLSIFKSSFLDDLARPNRFDVFIFLPSQLTGAFAARPDTLTLRCEASQLPGRTFATAEQKTYGPVEKYPYLTTYNDLELTFMVGGEMKEKKLFDEWMELVNPQSTNNFGYKNDYSTTIQINQYDQSGLLKYQASVSEAYPISVNQLDLDWSSDGYHKLSVTFAYTYWKKTF